MYLRLNASDKTLIQASYAGEVDSAVVFNANFLDLQNSEQEYSYDGSCADIRSGDIQHILDGTVEMDDYLTISLPDPLTQSGYKYWIGTHGGSSFLRKNEIEQNMTSENTGLNANTQPAGGVVILENGELAQSTEIIKELDPLIQDNITINREYVKTEQGTTWYVAYSNVEGSIISYCVFLNEREFSEKNF